MARNTLYPEGSAQMNVVVPAPVKERLHMIAERRRLSVSQLVTSIISDWLEEHGHLPTREPEREAVKAS
jgi:hypothetical protein